MSKLGAAATLNVTAWLKPKTKRAVPFREDKNCNDHCGDEAESHHDDSRVAPPALLLTELAFVAGQTQTASSFAFGDAAAVAVAAFEVAGGRVFIRQNRVVEVRVEGGRLIAHSGP